MHLKRLLGQLAARRPHVLDRMVVAYLIGNTVEAHEVAPLPICTHASMTRCVVSYNAVLEGGTAGNFWRNKSTSSLPICVNPLTWRADSATGGSHLHTGSVPLLAHLFLPSLDRNLVTARCVDGILYTSAPPVEKASNYPADIDGGPLGCCGRLHAVEFPLFWHNLRTNAATRVAAFLGNTTIEEEECKPCGANGGRCVGGLAWQAIVFALCTFVFLVVVCFPLACPCLFAINRIRGKPPVELWTAVLWSCCCPCFLCMRALRSHRGRDRRKRAAKREELGFGTSA